MNTETEQKVQKVDELLTDILVHFPYPMRRGETDFWPALKELSRLDIEVFDLAMTQRKKPLLPFWKAFELVNRRWPKLKLVKRVKELIEHAHDRLKEIGESELERIRRKAFAGAPKAKRLLEYLEAIQVDANKTAEIDWQDYKELLFGPGNCRIACDAPEPRLRRSGFSYSSALIIKPSRERCYARALEILTTDLRYEPLRDKARPLLCWMITIRIPDYYGVLKSNHLEWLVSLDEKINADVAEKSRKEEQRAQNRERQDLHRLRSIFTSHERALFAKVAYQKASDEFRTEVSEADFVRRISR
jgi:hypothetical protein